MSEKRIKYLQNQIERLQGKLTDEDRYTSEDKSKLGDKEGGLVDVRKAIERYKEELTTLTS